MPTTPEAFQELMVQLLDTNGEIQVPLSPEALVGMGVTVDDGVITITPPE